MNLSNITVINGPASPIASSDVDYAIAALGLSRFPEGYREYVTTLGDGVLGGTFVRVYPPQRIVNELAEFRERWREYWFWDAGADVLSRARALECVIVADTLNGDELLFHPGEPDRLFVLPRDAERVFETGPGLFEALDWLCGSGVLTEPFSERNFEPASPSVEPRMHQLLLVDPGPQRVAVLRIVREAGTFSLQEAQAALSTPRAVIRTGLLEGLEPFRAALEQSGATVECVPIASDGD